MTHGQYVNRLLMALSFPGCRVWKQSTGVAQSMDGQRVITFGLEGSADITGIIKGGRRLEIECKVGKDFLSQKQIAFQNMIVWMGGIYIESRNINETVDAVKKLIDSN